MTIDQAIHLARQHHDAGRLDQAEQIYRQVLAAAPNHPVALHLLGRVAMQSGHGEAAITLIRQALLLRPDYVEARYSLGLAQRQLGQTAAAIATFQEVVAAAADHFDARHSLGEALQAEGRSADSIEHYHHAIALRPDSAEPHNNLGSAYQELGQLAEALDSFRKALTVAPQNPVIHYNLGLALLAHGDFAEGCAEHEWRWKVQQLGLTHRDFTQPRWNGSDPRGRRILLYCEQGYGDSIQFLRYVPMLEQLGAEVILQLPAELIRLSSTVRGASQIVPFGETLPEFDVHLPMLSLPLMMGTTAESIPASIPYLHADPALVEPWRQRLESMADKKLKVGLAWAGRAEHWNDANRSIPVSLLREIVSTPGTAFISLQLSAMPLDGMVDWTKDIHNFADTAALIENLDLVICVDTAVAHLAGAMGKPVWLLLPFVADWRWLRVCNDSPWYPTMKLYRQNKPGDWEAPLRQVVQDLARAGR